MLTLIKLIHTLNRRIDLANSLAAPNIERQTKMRFQAICAIIALAWGGWGGVETARAESLDFVGIRQSLQSSTGDRSKPKRVGSIDTPGKSIVIKVRPQNRLQPSNQYSQNTPPTPPIPSAPPTPIKLQNDLNLPKTGDEVQITKNRALTLQEAIEIAFRNNREVQAARLTVNKSQTGIGEAQAAQALQVGLTSTLQTQGSPVIFGSQSPVNNNDTNIQGKLQATYSILDTGRNQSSVRAAEEQVKFDRLDLIRTEQKIRGTVITAYYDLQGADSSVIINQAAVKDATRSLSDAQLQEKAGVGTKFDILRAQVQLATANQDLTNAQGQQQTARKKIAQILVVDNNTEFKAADTVRELGGWGYSLEDSVVLAYKNRPEVKQQLVLRSVSEQQQIVAAAADSAQVNLFANYSLGKSLTTSLSAQDNYSLGAQFSWNFWDGGSAGARSNREKVNQEIYENQFTTTRNQIRFEVEQAYYSLGSSKKNIATSTQSLKQAEESLKLARLRFQAGVGTQTDVIQAQTELAKARGNRITAILNYNRALSTLRTATVLAE
ncbi:TolC family protein [Chamaesiphon sp. VAR_48_metabat_135_sub]|uniref:TolC family protein n=1 Tax=Chamaesiphon sp. VAR_48_metabat_135_sub TaxID=2964699 RepID=UPI00286C551E|nr:TolC family protein [Chamaesiphon sp. VAR_48_metabat_135_sub]